MNFADGGQVTGPDEFVEYIKNWVIQVEEEDGNEFKILTWDMFKKLRGKNNESN